jgi:hypothetical protein
MSIPPLDIPGPELAALCRRLIRRLAFFGFHPLTRWLPTTPTACLEGPALCRDSGLTGLFIDAPELRQGHDLRFGSWKCRHRPSAFDWIYESRPLFFSNSFLRGLLWKFLVAVFH